MAQGPGPPQRPQVGAVDKDLADSEPTENTLIDRAVRLDPHLGQSMPLADDIDLISFSNFV
jgi:hypothetical protein